MILRELLANLIFDRTFKEKVDFLRKVPLFSGFSSRSLGKVASIMHEKQYFANDIVFNEGQEGKVFYIVKSGEVTVTRSSTVLCRLGPGSYFGEMALLEELPRTATVTAAAPSVLYLVYKIKFDELVDYNPAIGVRIMRELASILSERLRQIMEKHPAETVQGGDPCKR